MNKGNYEKDDIHRVRVRGSGTKKDGRVTLRLNILTDLSRKQFELCGKVDIICCAEQRDAFSAVVSPSTTTNYFL